MKATQSVLLTLMLVLTLSISGCTSLEIPGLSGFCIPGLTCTGSTTEYENDVLIIKTLTAAPSTISTGQQLRLSAWILNNGAETVPQQTFSSSGTIYSGTASGLIKIYLYDTCEGLFSKIEVTCSEGTPTDDKRGCWINRVLPKQTIPISWSIVAYNADKIPLQTSCNLKVYVQYPYQTKSITSIAFVDYTEYQRMIDAGTFTAVTSYITEGYGPMKPYLTVEDTQPIPVKSGTASTTAMAFQIKNKGSGFLTSLYKPQDGKELIGIANGDIAITSNANAGSASNYDISDKINTEIKKMNDITLVGKESPKQTFAIGTPYNNQIEKVATYYMTTSIKYMYEFRKEIKVTITPPKITG